MKAKALEVLDAIFEYLENMKSEHETVTQVAEIIKGVVILRLDNLRT